MNRLWRHAIILGTCVAPMAVQAQEEDLGLYLFSIPSHSSASLSGTGANAPFAELHVDDTTRMAEGYANSSIKVVAIDNDIITVTANTVGTVSGEPLHEHMQPSFVVDYDEPAVTEMTERLVTLHGERPELHDLLQFTFDAIPEKTYLRDFDFASRVAERGEGDCTEHAVLLTALARATGRSARVVVGLLLIQENSNFAVYGHAWSEIYDDGRWQVADATMPSITMPEATVRYLPILQLKNEGPGYAFAMADMFGLFPSRVDLVTGSFPDAE